MSMHGHIALLNSLPLFYNPFQIPLQCAVKCTQKTYTYFFRKNKLYHLICVYNDTLVQTMGITCVSLCSAVVSMMISYDDCLCIQKRFVRIADYDDDDDEGNC